MFAEERTRKGSRREARYSFPVEGDDSEVNCSGTHCKSCTAGMIADCVALCCCPCGLINFLALAFVKVPWVVGRRCIGRVQRKRKKWVETRRKCKRLSEGDLVEGEKATVEEIEKKNFCNKDLWDILPGCSGWDEAEVFCNSVGNVSTRLEAERVCLELYQVCNLGFGRISFTGIQ